MFRNLFIVTSILIISNILGCPRPIEITPAPPTVTDQDQCPAACANLRSHKCEEGNPIDMKRVCKVESDCDSNQACIDGGCFASCEVFCRSTENEGVWLDPTCVKNITSCDQIDNCPLPIIKK